MITCKTCRSLDFKNLKKCSNEYKGQVEFSKFQSKKEKNQKRDEYQSETDHIHLHLRITTIQSKIHPSSFEENIQGRVDPLNCGDCKI